MKKTTGILFASLILCFYAFYNKYPLVYSDTGTYIASGFDNYYPFDRPIFYGLFIRHISMKGSLMLVVFVQALMVSYSIFLLFKNFSTTLSPVLWTLISSLVLTLCTGLSFHVSQLIPDIFSSIGFISFILLLMGTQLTFIQKLIVSILFIFSTIVHLSNFPTIVLIWLSVLIWNIARKNQSNFKTRMKRLIYLGSLIACSYVIVCSTRYYYVNKFSLTNTTSVFRLNRLIEFGILQEFLNEHCASQHYPICEYKDSPELNWNFLWGANSPSYKNGGWEAHELEYNQLISDIFSEKKFVIRYVQKSIESSLIQFFLFETGDAAKGDAEGSPRFAIENHFKMDLHEYLGTRQIQGQLDFKTLNYVQLLIVFLSIFFATLLYYHREFNNPRNKTLKELFSLLIVFLFLNAFICGCLSTTLSRYQSRVVWLLPLFILIAFSSKDFRRQISYLKNHNS